MQNQQTNKFIDDFLLSWNSQKSVTYLLLTDPNAFKNNLKSQKAKVNDFTQRAKVTYHMLTEIKTLQKKFDNR